MKVINREVRKGLKIEADLIRTVMKRVMSGLTIGTLNKLHSLLISKAHTLKATEELPCIAG